MIYRYDALWGGYLPQPVDPWSAAPDSLSPIRWFG